jgi:hypothetical protein
MGDNRCRIAFPQVSRTFEQAVLPYADLGRPAISDGAWAAARKTSMWSWHEPQPVPASQASPTSSTVRAPRAMHDRITASGTA